MTAAAFLKSNPKPNDDDIDGAMAGNLCRCATYLRIRAGIKLAAEIASGIPQTRAGATTRHPMSTPTLSNPIDVVVS